MPTVNEEYRDAAIRHQIGLRRYSAGLAARVARLLEEADAELTAELRVRLAKFEGRPPDFTSARFKALLEFIKTKRAEVMQEYKDLLRGELGALSVMEGNREATLIKAAVPFEITFAAVAAEQLRAIATSRPFQGRLLNDWFRELERQDGSRLMAAIRLGMVEGQTTDQIVTRVIGTRAKGYTDGILSVSRRDANAIVRTAVSHISNTARNYVWDANEDVIAARIWVATLDGRTTAVCRSRDGHGSPVGGRELPPGIKPLQPKDARPPAHFNCRSIMVAYLDGVGLIGKRPFVTDTRTRDKREVDFRKMAKAQGKSIQEVRAAWAARNIGRVPAATTYQDFLGRQPASFQDEVLGRTKGRLFRSGGLTLDQFVDRTGNELTLGQLAQTRPEAFIKAGLDPGDF